MRLDDLIVSCCLHRRACRLARRLAHLAFAYVKALGDTDSLDPSPPPVILAIIWHLLVDGVVAF
jgi:hypothetical protein